MKPTKQLIEETEPILAALHWQLAPRHEIEAALSKMFTEIQRDAREGVVPAEDVYWLLGELTVLSSTEGSRKLIDAFRAKHRNLFTK